MYRASMNVPKMTRGIPSHGRLVPVAVHSSEDFREQL